MHKKNIANDFLASDHSSSSVTHVVTRDDLDFAHWIKNATRHNVE